MHKVQGELCTHFCATYTFMERSLHCMYVVTNKSFNDFNSLTPFFSDYILYICVFSVFLIVFAGEGQPQRFVLNMISFAFCGIHRPKDCIISTWLVFILSEIKTNQKLITLKQVKLTLTVEVKTFYCL